MDMKSLVPWRRGGGEISKSGAAQGAPSLFSLHRQMNRLFDEFFQDFEGPLSRSFATEWPAIEVQDGEKDIKIVAELPGLEEKDIDLSLRDGVLTIKGEKTRKTDGAVYSEHWHGQFIRSVELGHEIDPDKVKASFDKGVLTVTVEKQPNPKAATNKIAINRG